MKSIKPAVHACLALSLTACSSVGDLSVDIPDETSPKTLELDFPLSRAVEHRLPLRISGGIPPYESSIEGCPDWVTLFHDQGILAGTAPASDQGRTFFCTYVVTDSGITTPQSTTFGLRLAVVAPSLVLPSVPAQTFVIGTFRSFTLPVASGGVAPYTYSFRCAGDEMLPLPPGIEFAPETRVLAGSADAVFRDSCAYTVADSSRPAVTVSRDIEVTSEAAPLELTQVFEETVSGNRLVLNIGRRSQTKFQMASGGVAPYTYEVVDCALPDGLEFHPGTRILSGTPDAEYRGPNCTYRVTDSSASPDGSSPPASVSLSFVLVVEPLEAGDWRFRTRTVDESGGPCVIPGRGARGVATLPAAHAGGGVARYALPGAPHPRRSGFNLSFNPSNRVLTYANPSPPPVFGTPNTYRYLIGTAASVDASNAIDAL